MWPYFIPIILCFPACFINAHNVMRKNYEEYAWLFLLTVLIIFAGIRGNGSGDYFEYIKRGSEIKTFFDIFSNSIRMDTGYCFLSWIVNIFHLPSQAVIMFMNLISICCIGIFIKRYSNIPVLSVLLFLPFFYQFDMHAARTACAIGIMTLSTPYVLERKPVKFAIIIFVAFLFHAEALIALVLYFLFLIKIDLTKGIIFLFVDLLIAIPNLTDRLCLFILSKVGLTSAYNRFLGYTQEGHDFIHATKLYDPRFTMFFLIFVFACVRLQDRHDVISRFLLNTSFSTIFLMIFFLNHAFMCYRMSSFYGIYSIILIPNLIRKKDNDISIDNSLSVESYYSEYVIFIFVFVLLSIAYAINLGTGVPYKIFEVIYW